MTISIGSHITISKQQALTLAAEKVAHILRSRENRRQEFIARELKRLNKPSFFKTLFRIKDYTEEEIVERENDKDFPMDSEIWLIDQMYGDLEDLCFAVQSACRISAGETIQLSIEDAERIQ